MKSLLKFLFYFFNWNRIHDSLLLTPFEKRDRIRYFAKSIGAVNFVETGSYHGDTSKALADIVNHVVTIEIDPSNAALATHNCAGVPNVKVHCGPSEDILPIAIRGLVGPTLFWLDAHYQTGMTKGSKKCPLFAELQIIFDKPEVDPTILIDDARKFIWINGWPSLSSVRLFAEKNGYSFRVSHDMICLGKFSM